MSAAPLQAHTVSSVVPPAPAYPFLARPPPQKKRPTQPLPSPPVQTAPINPVIGRRRSATTSAIAAWVANIQPGSPALLTPRRPSISPLSSSRRPSGGSVRVASASFLNILDTPITASSHRITPSFKDFKPDLTAVGYASIFVRLPNTPSSSALPHFSDHRAVAPISPVLEEREKPVRRGLKHFRSLGALKSSRSKQPAMPSIILSPTRAKAQVPSVPTPSTHMRAPSKESVSKSKKSQYAKYRPPPLASELALAQLTDGGKMDEHIRRFAEAQARAGGAQVVNGKLVGVGDVYRDGEGGVWRDQDEEWEYAHLLGGDNELRAREGDWVRFGSNGAISVTSADAEERRESVSSNDSDLDPRYAMQPESGDDLAVFGSAVMPAVMRKPGMSVLALPSRNRRAAPHLRKPEFLLDIFPVPGTPVEPYTKQPLVEIAPDAQDMRPTGKARRRPAPLTLVPPTPPTKRPTNPLDDVRKDFLASSFAPAPAPAAHHQRPSAPSQAAVRADNNVAAARKMAVNAKLLKVDVRGFFKVMGGKKDI